MKTCKYFYSGLMYRDGVRIGWANGIVTGEDGTVDLIGLAKWAIKERNRDDTCPPADTFHIQNLTKL